MARGRPGDLKRNVGPPGGDENGDAPGIGLGAHSTGGPPTPGLRMFPNFANHRGTSIFPNHDGCTIDRDPADPVGVRGAVGCSAEGLSSPLFPESCCPPTVNVVEAIDCCFTCTAVVAATDTRDGSSCISPASSPHSTSLGGISLVC